MKTGRIQPGVWCAVRDMLSGGTIVEGMKVQGGVRLQTGEHFGEKRVEGEYQMLECITYAGPMLTALAYMNEL